MRKSLVRLHLWLGLLVGLLWALQGLTGALLVFHRDIDRLGHNASSQSRMISLDTIVEAAERQSGAAVKMVTIADGRGDLLNVHVAASGGTKLLQVDASTGRTIAVREYEPSTPFDGSGWRWVYLLHEALLLGDSGETLIGISGLLLFSSLLIGVWIGWPKRGHVRSVFAVRRWRTTSTKLYGWHRLAGLLAAIVLLITVPSGIWMIFAADLRPVVARKMPHELPFKAAPVEALDIRISPQQALERARTHFPAASFVRLTQPTPAAPVYVVRLRQNAEVRTWSGTTTISVSPATGRTLHVYDPVTAPISNKLADAAFSIHSGELGSLAGRLLVFATGLSLPALYLTGVIGWARRVRRRRRASALLRGTELVATPAE